MLKKMEEEGFRFSYTTDEWSSKGNKRYSNINVHLPGGRFHRLGMVRIKESFPAEKAVELFTKTLEEFDLKLENQVGISTDGCSMMQKMGTLLGIFHQLCLELCSVRFGLASVWRLGVFNPRFKLNELLSVRLSV